MMTVMDITAKQDVAGRILRQASTMENGTIHVWQNTKDGSFSTTPQGWRYIDGFHELMFSVEILNERKPYTKKKIIKIIDYKLKNLTS